MAKKKSNVIEVAGVAAHVDQEVRNVRTDNPNEKAALAGAAAILGHQVFANEAELKVKVEADEDSISVSVAVA